jgi:hypothetical protein
VSAPSDSDPHDRPTAERLVPEILRRVIEAGTENLGSDAIRQLLGDLKLPREAKEALSHTLSQLDETKNGVYRAISKEVRELLDRTSLAEELAKALSLLTLEVKMEVRFKPSTFDTNSKGLDASVRFKRSSEGQTSSPPEGNDSEGSKSAAPPAHSSQTAPSTQAEVQHPSDSQNTDPTRHSNRVPQD